MPHHRGIHEADFEHQNLQIVLAFHLKFFLHLLPDRVWPLWTCTVSKMALPFTDHQWRQCIVDTERHAGMIHSSPICTIADQTLHELWQFINLFSLSLTYLDSNIPSHWYPQCVIQPCSNFAGLITAANQGSHQEASVTRKVILNELFCQIWGVLGQSIQF